MSPYSIVHVLSSFGVGGQERVALDLAIGQCARGHTVSVISLAPGPDGAMADEFREHGIAVSRVAKQGDGIDPLLVPRLARVLRDHAADVVHTHNPLPLIYGAPAARLAGAAAIHTKHGVNPGSRSHMLLRRAAAQLTHAFVAVSDTTEQQARQQKDAPARRLHMIANGIRLDRYHPDPDARAEMRAELGIPADAWVVGSVGRLDDYKNQSLLVRAMGPLLSPRVRLVIVGDGPARATVEAEVAKLRDPALVVMTGRRMDVPRIMPAFDVFALSSKTEGLPLVVPEAMSAGLPIVATAVGGLPSVVDDATGMLVPVDEEPLRAALHKLEQDRALARKLGTQARETALARYSHDRMVDAYLSLYDQARR